MSSLLLTAPRLDAAADDEPSCSDFAGKTIRWIVPQPPGGGYDAYSRLIAPFYARRLGAKVVVENVVGAGGTVGLEVIRNARPDGTTVGLMNAPGMVVASVLGDVDAPNPLTDFSILGRVAATNQVWAAAKGSGWTRVEDVLDAARRNPVLVGIQDVQSTNFAGFAVGSHLIGLDSEFVVGYPGTAAVTMAALRGEVDLVAFTFDSIRSVIEAGELKPLLQISDSLATPHPALEGVSVLAGPSGLAARRANLLGRDIGEALKDADALVDIMTLGRVMVAPSRLETDLRKCLERSLEATLRGRELQETSARGGWPLDLAPADVTAERLRKGAGSVTRFLPVLREAMRRARG